MYLSSRERCHIIYKQTHFRVFIAKCLNFEKLAKMNNFIFNTDVTYFNLSTYKSSAVNNGNFLQVCYESLYSFLLSACTIATILPSAVLLDFNEDGTRGHTLEFYISSRRGKKKDIWSWNDIHWRLPREDNTCFCLSPARHAKSVQW